MKEEQMQAWQLKPHTIQARVVKRLLAEGRVLPSDVNAAEKVLSVNMSKLRRKLAPYDIAMFSTRDGSHAYTMSDATRAMLNAGGLRGADADAVRELALYNARFKPAPGKSIHQLTKAALEARIARAEAGDREALGIDAAAQIAADGRVRPCDVAAGEKVAQALVSPLRRKLAPFAIAIFCRRDGSHAYTISDATRALLNAGGLHGADEKAVRALALYNARFKPAPGNSIHELTRAALEARIARAEAGDRDALGIDAAAQIAADVQRILPHASAATVQAYLNTLGLAKARAAIGVRRDGADFVVKARTRDPWRPGDPKPVFQRDGRAA